MSEANGTLGRQFIPTDPGGRTSRVNVARLQRAKSVSILSYRRVRLQLPQHFELSENFCETKILKEDDGLGHRFVEVYDVQFLAARVLLHFSNQSCSDSLSSVFAVYGELREPADTRGKDDVADALLADKRPDQSLHANASVDRFERVLP